LRSKALPNEISWLYRAINPSPALAEPLSRDKAFPSKISCFYRSKNLSPALFELFRAKKTLSALFFFIVRDFFICKKDEAHHFSH